MATTIRDYKSLKGLMLATGLGIFLAGGAAAQEVPMQFTLKDYLRTCPWTRPCRLPGGGKPLRAGSEKAIFDKSAF